MRHVISFKNNEEKQIIITYLKEGKYPNHINKDQKRSLRAKAEKFALINDLLYLRRDGKTLRYIYFPAEKEIAEIELKILHLPGHLGMKKLWFAVNERFHGIPQEFVHEYVRSCKACLCNEPLKKRNEMTGDASLINLTRSGGPIYLGRCGSKFSSLNMKEESKGSGND